MKDASSLYLQRLEGAMRKLQKIPLWGATPLFPWEKVSARLKESLLVESLQIQTKNSRFLEQNELLSGLGQDPTLLTLELTPLEGSAFWAMPKSEIEKLTSILLTQEGINKGFSHEEFNAGYALFLFLKVLHILNEENAFGPLTAQIAPTTEFPAEGAICLDLSIEINRQILWARLICSEMLNETFMHYFASEPHSPFSNQAAQDLLLPLSLEIGKTELSTTQWKKIKKGDLVLLDSCNFDPAQGKGSGILAIAGLPFFNVRLKDAEVKILEYAYHQEEMPMPHSHTPSPEESEGKEESDFTPDREGSAVEELLSKREIPLTLSVEVTKITLPLEKIIQLRPGNLLDLKTNPQLLVSLTVNGQPLARGELVKIGESLGVRILALQH